MVIERENGSEEGSVLSSCLKIEIRTGVGSEIVHDGKIQSQTKGSIYQNGGRREAKIT